MSSRLISRNSRLVRYMAAVAATGIGLLVRLALTAWVGPGLPTYITFYPAVMVVALLGGLGPGLVATAAAAVAVDYWLLAPHGFGINKPVDVVGLVFFLGMGLFMCLVAEFFRRARVKAAAFDREQALCEARQEKEFLANILERAAQPFAVGNPDGRISLLNRAFEELTGYTAEELRSMNWVTTLTPPEWRELEHQKLEELDRTGQPVRYEKEYFRKDGHRVPIELLVHLARSLEGKPEYYYSFITDITGRKQAEAAVSGLNVELQQRVAELQAANEALGTSRKAALNLMEDALQARKETEQASAELRSTSEQRRLALEAADLGAWDYQFLAGEVFWDERCREMWGIPQNDHVDYATAISRIHPGDRAGVDTAVKEAIAGRGGGSYHREFRVEWPDGSVHWIYSHGQVYFQGEGAERHAVRFIGANQEITERKRREDQLQQLNRTLTALKDSGNAMMHATSEAEYLDQVCRLVVEDCSHTMVWIGFAENDEARSVRPVAHAGFEKGYLKTLRLTWADTERGRGPTGTAIRTGKPSACANMLTDPRFAPWRAEGLQRGYASSLAVPLLAEGRAFGAITIYSEQPDPFSEDEVRLLAQLADDLSYCIHTLRLRAARERAEGRTELLAETASQLLTTDVPQRIVEDLCRKMLGFLDCQAFFNYLVDERAGRLHLNACAGIPAEAARETEWLDYGAAVCGCAARDACRIVAEDIQHTSDPRTELVKSFGIQAYACHPLLIGGRVLGTVSFGTRVRTRFTDEELSLMKAVTDLVAIAMERQRVQAALQKMNEELEQRVAERTAELHATSRYARSLIEASLDPLVTISPEGKITDVNAATEEVTGISRQSLVGTSFSNYCTEPGKAEAGYQKVLAEGLIRDYPLTIRHASGRTTDVLYNATVYRDEAGQVQGVFAAARDITERKQAERRRDFTSALLALFAHKASASEYLRSVVEVIREWTGCQALGIRIADQQGEIPYESWAGFEPEFIKLENRLSLKRDNCCCIRAISEDFEEPDQALLTPGGSYRCDDAIAFVNKLAPEKRARYRGNCMKFGFASLAIIPVRYRDGVIGALHLADRRPGQFPPSAVEFLETMTPLVGEAVHRFQMEAELARHRDQLELLVGRRTQELTAANTQLQQAAEELERSNRDLEQFAYVASHDLQEPLRAVGGYVKLLERRLGKGLDARAREFITGAFDGALRMERLITDLLAFSRVGTRGGEFVPTGLDAVFHQVLANLHASIESAQATVTHDPLPTLTVDGTQLMQLFQNLIGNALKFRGGPPPAIHLGAQKQDGRWVFSVRDNGIGIEPQYFEKIFQIFQRLHTRKDYSGTGIGLAICKKIVERHGGTIWVESQPGQGSTFFFSLPDTTG